MSTRARAGWRAAGWGREGGREGIIPPRRFQNPYIKCVGPGIKDPEAGGEPRESQISAKPRLVSGLNLHTIKMAISFFVFFFLKFNPVIPIGKNILKRF
jgi:hypothetical protein